MVDKNEMPGPNVVDLLTYQAARRDKAQSRAQAITPRDCRHCGAALLDGESDDDCSSASITASAPMQRKFYAD